MNHRVGNTGLRESVSRGSTCSASRRSSSRSSAPGSPGRPVRAFARRASRAGMGAAQFAIDAGELHTCAVRNDGTVRCWGYNADGQLGDGSTTDRLTPVTVTGLNTAVTVSAGHLSHLRAPGGRHRPLLGRQFERPARRQLDHPATEHRSPSAGSAMPSRSAPAASTPARSWPTAPSGAGARTATASSAMARRPTAARPGTVSGLTNVTALAAGVDHTCALRTDGTVRAGASTTSASSAMARRHAPHARRGERPDRRGRHRRARADLRRPGRTARCGAGATTPSASSAMARRRTASPPVTRDAASPVPRRSRRAAGIPAPVRSDGTAPVLGRQRLRPARGRHVDEPLDAGRASRA